MAFWLLAFWPQPAAPQPLADLTPGDVVKTVVNALRNCNSPSPNAGVFVAYRFASPANHASTGPYGRFLRAVKSGAFAPMLRVYPSELDSIEINGKAEQILRVHLNRDHDVAFKFTLSRQRDGPYRDCWMVDSVQRLLPGQL